MASARRDDGADTLIFLDVDGVLNVGVRGDRGAPLLLSNDNMEALFVGSDNCADVEPQQEVVLKIWSAARRYCHAVCEDGKLLSETLVERLVNIMRSAGPRTHVVLSSSWRHLRHLDSCEVLEAAVSLRLGRRFKFDGRTEIVEETSQADRIRLIGDYIEQHCLNSGAKALSVLVLDDLFVAPLNGWICCGHQIRDVWDVERYLRGRAPQGCEVRAKFLHCYEEWETDGGVPVQAGVGLTDKDVETAKLFLSGELGISGLLAVPVKWGSRLSGSRRLRRWAHRYGA